MPFMKNRHYAGGIVVRRRKGRNGRLVVEILVMQVARGLGLKKNILTQFPGGMQEPVDSSNPERTLRRELLAETGLEICPDAEPMHLHSFLASRGHEKHFFVVHKRDCEGILRTKPIEDGVNTVLGPPYWADVKALGGPDGILCKSQRIVLPFLEEAIEDGVIF